MLNGTAQSDLELKTGNTQYPISFLIFHGVSPRQDHYTMMPGAVACRVTSVFSASLLRLCWVRLSDDNTVCVRPNKRCVVGSVTGSGIMFFVVVVYILGVAADLCYSVIVPDRSLEWHSSLHSCLQSCCFLSMLSLHAISHGPHRNDLLRVKGQLLRLLETWRLIDGICSLIHREMCISPISLISSLFRLPAAAKSRSTRGAPHPPPMPPIALPQCRYFRYTEACTSNTCTFLNR